MALELFFSLVGQVGEPDQLTSAANDAEIGAGGRQDHVFQGFDSVAQEVVEVSLGDGHPEGEMQVGATQVGIDQDDLVAEDGQADAEVGCQDSLAGSPFTSRNSPGAFLQAKVIEENRSRIFGIGSEHLANGLPL